MRNKKRLGIAIAAGLAAVLLLAGLLFALFTAKKVKAPPVEVPGGFELMEISALAKARKIEILSNGSTAEVKADEESGGLLFSGTPSEIEKIVVRWKKDVDFGSFTAGWLVINALCGEEAGASVRAVLDSSCEASVKAAVRETDGAWNGEKNNCCDIHSQQLNGRHALSMRVDFEDGAAEKPVSLLLKNVLFIAYSLPVAEVNIDESRGTIADMNSDHAHKTMCYGSMTLHIPEGYRSEFMEEEGATQTFELDYIRGRGNTTWNTDKKPYKIKLKEPAPLLGLGANTQWGLLANYYDISLIRNRYTYWLGDRIGMEYTPQCTPVDVVMNGSYLGSYCLSELVRLDENRVDLDRLTEDVTEGEELTGGYLLSTYKDNPPENSFTIASGDEYAAQLSFVIESPGAVVQAQQDYIRNCLQTVDDAICSADLCDRNGVSYKEYLDVDSLINYYLIESMSNNGDAFRNGSTYLYKKRGGKLYWGPLWDFDLAAWDSLDYTSKNDIGFTSFSEYPWFRQLYDKDPEFREKLLARIKEVDAVVRESAADGGKIDGFVREIYLSQKANYALCRSNLDITETDVSGVTFDSEIERYKKILTGIADWQDESAVVFLAFRRQAIFYIGDDIQDAIDFTDWPIDESAILVPDIKGRTFLGWYYDAGDGNEIPIGEYVPGNNEREIHFNAKFAED